jgi:hypothetical protein
MESILVLIVVFGAVWLMNKVWKNAAVPSGSVQRRRYFEERRKREERERQERLQKQQALIESSCQIAPGLLERHASVVELFFTIAERKVSSLDEYGDENWGILDSEIRRCISKLVTEAGGYISKPERRRNRSNLSDRPRRTKDLQWDGYIDLEWQANGCPEVIVSDRGEYDTHALYSELFYGLEQRFRAYHGQQSNRGHTQDEIGRMNGVEFENYLMRILSEHGCTVSGTPKTGDKGADIVARIANRVIVVQAKRSASPVGTSAVQEVTAARGYYSGTEAWVVTNSTFTEAARELAQKNAVKLIAGAELIRIGQFLKAG